MSYYLAIDIGASSGRHILGSIQNGALSLEEIYRFENKLIRDKSGALCWDTEYLYSQILNGLARCGESNRVPKTIAIDTWAVDYVLLDGEKNVLAPVYSYRDGSTAEAVNAVGKILPQCELYNKTGIQFQPFNTIYQLYRDKLSEKLGSARHFMMLPEYFSYLLTGVMTNEYTNATSTGLVNARTKQWDGEILNALGISESLFLPLSYPAEPVGMLTADVQKTVGFNSTVVLCPSHDTASAFAVCPKKENTAYISSGTWSLIGVQSKEPIISDCSRKANFTNEGAANGGVCFLKNCMGMWLLQGIRRDLGKDADYNEMMRMAQNAKNHYYIDVNAPELVSPESMSEAIRALLCIPKLCADEVAATVYHSLAKSYAQAVREIESITGRTIDEIRIAGGGSRDEFLNRLTAEYTGKSVVTGPAEATAAGNILSQLKYAGIIKNNHDAESIIAGSFV